MTSLTTYASIPYPVSTDQLVDYPSTAATAAQYVDPLPNTNIIHNPAFTVNQRVGNAAGITATNPADGTYIIDRWRYNTNRSAGTATAVYNPAPASAQTIGDFPYVTGVYQMTGTGMTHTSTSLSQRIEDVRQLNGQVVTLSFYAKYTTTATTLSAITLRQNFGTGGSPSADVTTTIASNVALTASWARYSYTFTVPSISGKTLGTTRETSMLELKFDVGSAANYNLSIWGVQLEQRPTTSRFVIPDYGTELVKCRRYYYEINNRQSVSSNIVGNGYKTTTTICSFWLPFPVTMWGRPANTPPTFSSSGFAVMGYSETAGSRTGTAVSASPLWDGATVFLTASTGTSAAFTVATPFWASAAADYYIGFSSEL